MAIQTMVIDPQAAEELTPDQVIAKINAASDNISRAASVEAAARPLVDGEVTAAKVDAGVAKANLDSMADLDRGYIKTDPGVGQFKIISQERMADGKLEIKYDDGV